MTDIKVVATIYNGPEETRNRSLQISADTGSHLTDTGVGLKFESTLGTQRCVGWFNREEALQILNALLEALDIEDRYEFATPRVRPIVRVEDW